MLPVNSDTAVAPSIKQTWFLALVTRALGKLGGRDGWTIERGENGADEGSDSGSVDASDAPGSGTAREGNGTDGATAGAKNARAVATTMAGGRRRKAVSSRKKQ